MPITPGDDRNTRLGYSIGCAAKVIISPWSVAKIRADIATDYGL
jgi:hypothetical protein